MHAPQTEDVLTHLPQKGQDDPVSTRPKRSRQLRQRDAPGEPQPPHNWGYMISTADLKRSSTVFIKLQSVRERKGHQLPTVNRTNASSYAILFVKC